MAPRTIYANLADGLQPFTLWDTSLADMGSLGIIPCTAVGTNAIVLTPVGTANAPTPAYANNNQFSFVAVATSSGAVSVNVNGLGVKNVYKLTGSTQVSTGDIVSGNFYEIAYSAALNSGAGGFYLLSASFENLASNAIPLPDAIGAAGTSTLYSRGDHVHPAAALTNTRLAKTANYTVTTADRWSTIALGGSSFYALTFAAASGYDANFTVSVLNEDTGRGKSLLIQAGTSATSFAIGTGSKAFTTQASLPIGIGARVRIWSLANNANWMSGIVTAYVTTTLTVLVDTIGGSGTFTDWQIGNETILWPLQSVVVFNSNNTWSSLGKARYAVTTSLTINVDTSGADTNDGLATTTGAFKTIGAAIAALYKSVDNQNNLPIISVASGQTFTEGITLTQYGQLTGASTLFIQGSGGAFTWKPANNFCLQFGDNSIVIISNITFDGTATAGNIAISGHQTGICDVNAGVTFGPFPTGYHFFMDTNTKINFNNAYTISGGAAYHINLSGGSNQVAFNSGFVTTVTGSPAFSVFLRMFGGGSGMTFAAGQTWSGAFTVGMKQWEITGPSSIYLAGLTIPGSVAGTAVSGGVTF